MFAEAKASLYEGRKVLIEGFALGNDIYLPTSTPFKFFSNIWHELGHLIGWQFSFLDGEVLTPDEVKKTSIELSFATQSRLFFDILLNNKIKPGTNRKLWPTAYKVLQTFTKGGIDGLDFNLYLDCTDDEIAEVVMKHAKGSGSIVKVESNGELNLINNRISRNQEIPANTVQAGCFHILTNSLGPFIKARFGEKNIFNTPYFRALNIVKRAYQYPGYVLPSYVDMKRIGHTYLNT